MSVKFYQFYEHTADIGMKVYGKSLEDLLINASRGMLSLIYRDIKFQDPEKYFQKELIAIEADSPELLLLKWLQEILFRIEIHHHLYHSFQIEIAFPSKKALIPYKLKGYIWITDCDKTRHEICMEIKAVTRHQLMVKRKSTGWEANIIFDV